MVSTTTATSPTRQTFTLVTLLQFIGMGLIWGSSFLFIKVALNGVSFGQVAWARTILGAITLTVVMLIGRNALPRDRVIWLHFVLLAAVNCVGPYLLFAWAEQYVTSSLASIYNAVTPIMTALIVTLGFRAERLTRGQVLGILIGIFGVLVIVGPWRAEVGIAGNLLGQLACLGAVTCYGFSYSYTRKYLAHRPIEGSTIAFMNIGIAAIYMLLLTPIIAWQPVQLNVWVVGSLLLLGAFGTGIAYIWNFNVLKAWGATSASTVTYLTPVVGVLLGVLLLGENLSWNEPVGALLVFVGILFTQQRLRMPHRDVDEKRAR